MSVCWCEWRFLLKLICFKHWQSCWKVSRKNNSSNYSYWGSSMRALIDLELRFVHLCSPVQLEVLWRLDLVLNLLFSALFCRLFFFPTRSKCKELWGKSTKAKLKINYGVGLVMGKHLFLKQMRFINLEKLSKPFWDQCQLSHFWCQSVSSSDLLEMSEYTNNDHLLNWNSQKPKPYLCTPDTNIRGKMLIKNLGK